MAVLHDHILPEKPDVFLAAVAKILRVSGACVGGVLLQHSKANSLLETVAGELAFGLSHVTHLLHPEVIVLGGGLALVGELLRQAVAEALPSQIMEVFRPGPAVRLAQLGEDAVPVGALVLAGAAADVPARV